VIVRDERIHAAARLAAFGNAAVTSGSSARARFRREEGRISLRLVNSAPVAHPGPHHRVAPSEADATAALPLAPAIADGVARIAARSALTVGRPVIAAGVGALAGEAAAGLLALLAAPLATLGFLALTTAPAGEAPGVSVANARPGGIPEDWTATPSSKGGGTRYINPKNGNDVVRVMPGKRDASWESQREPYVIRQKDGRFFDEAGSVVGRLSAESHVPLRDFTFRR